MEKQQVADKAVKQLSKLTIYLIVVGVFIALYTITAVILTIAGYQLPMELTQGVFGLASAEGIMCCIIKMGPNLFGTALKAFRKDSEPEVEYDSTDLYEPTDDV